MGMWIGRNRKARVTYGFDEIALVPGRVTINPNEVDITWRLARRDAEPLEFKIPILASAMDGVVDVRFRHRDEQSSAGLPCSISKAFKPATRTRRKFCKKSSKPTNRMSPRFCKRFIRNRCRKI